MRAGALSCDRLCVGKIWRDVRDRLSPACRPPVGHYRAVNSARSDRDTSDGGEQDVRESMYYMCS